MIMFRLLVARIALLPSSSRSAAARRGGRHARARLGRIRVGVVNGAIPFTLIAWGEKHIDSGVAAIANATVPIFVVLLALRFKPSEPSRARGSAGSCSASSASACSRGCTRAAAGGESPGRWRWSSRPSRTRWAASGASASSCARAAVLSNGGDDRRDRGAGAVRPRQLPDHVPGWKATGSVIALAVIGTAVAQILLYRVLRSDGARAQPRHLPAPGDRADVRRAAARRAADVAGAGRNGADPRRGRARIRCRALPAARAGAAPSP